jgi:hypothetical protein
MSEIAIFQQLRAHGIVFARRRVLIESRIRLLSEVVAYGLQSHRAQSLGALPNLPNVVHVESGINVSHHKRSKLSVPPRKTSQLRQRIPVVYQKTSYRLTVAFANSTVVALSI